MPVSLTTLTGPIYLPNGATPIGGRVSFELSSWDREEGEALVVSGPTYSNIDENGQFSVELFTTTEGVNTVNYRMYVLWEDSTLSQSYVNEVYVSSPAPHYTKKYIGSFALSGLGPFSVSDLNIMSELELNSFDVLLECQAYALAAKVSVEGASTALNVLVVDANNAADLSQAWAESPTSPDGGPSSKSSKTWAGEASTSAASALVSKTAVEAVAGLDRAAMVTHIAGGFVPTNGVTYHLDGVEYLGETGATAILDLSGLIPVTPATPQHFGAVGDGVADDGAAIAAMLAYTGIADWGDKTYRTTSALAVTGTNILWKSSGAIIRYDGAAGIKHVVNVNLSGSSAFSCAGALTIDANLKSYTALWVEQTGAFSATVDLEKMACINTRRSGTAHDGGGGFRIVGKFSTVTLTDPKVRECKLAAGAGIVGVDGVCGINIRAATHDDGRNPAAIRIINPDIRGVYSEDAAVIADQDGIIVWTNRDYTPDPVETTANISGGYFENCWGRAVKVQTERAFVADTSIVRTTGSSTDASNPDIDCQVGSCSVVGVNAIYDGFVPYGVVGIATPSDIAKNLPSAIARGIQVTVKGGATLSHVVQNGPKDFTGQIVRASDISVVGNLTQVFRFNAANSGSGFHLFAQNIDAAPILRFLTTGTGVGSGTAQLTNCLNTGAAVPLFGGSSNFLPVVSAIGCFGWVEDFAVTTTQQNFTRLGTVVGKDTVTGGGFQTFSRTVVAGATWTLPRRSVATNRASLMLVSVGSSRNSQALIAGDWGGCVIAAQPGSDFVAALSAEPATGSYRVWGNGSDIFLKNATGTDRTVTLLILG